MNDEFICKPKVAYLSMEIALQNGLPAPSFGLGVLAGDALLSAADHEIPMVTVPQVSQADDFKQKIASETRQPVTITQGKV